jgi:hypothetical protein
MKRRCASGPECKPHARPSIVSRPHKQVPLVDQVLQSLHLVPSRAVEVPFVEKLWLEEAERYAQYLRGEVDAIPGDEVMAEARKRLK